MSESTLVVLMEDWCQFHQFWTKLNLEVLPLRRWLTVAHESALLKMGQEIPSQPLSLAPYE
jgi:hypothetical protein